MLCKYTIGILFLLMNAVSINGKDHWGNFHWMNTTVTKPVCDGIKYGNQVPDPLNTANYYICCGESIPKVQFTCTWQDINVQYPAFKKTFYDPFKGLCTNTKNIYPPNLQYPKSIHTRYALDVCNAKPPIPRLKVLGPLVDPSIYGQFVPIINSNTGNSSTGVLGIHIAQVPNTDKILIWDRRHQDATPYQPGIIGTDGNPEISTIYDTISGIYVASTMRSAPFCSAGSHLGDGSILITGGDAANGEIGNTNGLQAIRTFSNDIWTTSTTSLSQPRWYPTQVLLPDGKKTIITGGHTFNGGQPVPSLEIYDSSTNTLYPEQNISLLAQKGTNYPLHYVLPWRYSIGNATLFLFNCNGGNIMSVLPSGTLIEHKRLPAFPATQFCSGTAAAGSGVMLMLKPETNYSTVIAMFGGYTRTAAQCGCDTPSHNLAFSVNVDKASIGAVGWSWVTETMPGYRNMVDNVLLPNGQVLLVNGVQNGTFTSSRNPVLDAWLYNPNMPVGNRFSVLAASAIPRRYHSTALLLPDASVLITGSETGECFPACAQTWKFYNYEFTAERFLPPYFTQSRPSIASISQTSVRMGSLLGLSYSGTANIVVLMRAGVVTHQNNMGQRGIKLVIVANSNITKHMNIRMPPAGGLVAQPGWYMLFILNNDIPCMKAKWINLTL